MARTTKRLIGTADRGEEADQDCEGDSKTGEAAGGTRGKQVEYSLWQVGSRDKSPEC